jgi:sterol desaturase/sphingolipid hydroxylase (fatty acid hydroxylase superfamily)
VIIASLAMTSLGWLLVFMLWFVIWAPLIALLEYGTHRWIMHVANRALDPQLRQLRSHAGHHRGANDPEFIDVPLKNCLLLTSPAFLLMALWGFAIGPWSGIVLPGAALLAWSFFYKYLWARMHRAIHGMESNWFQRCGPVFRFFRDHHLEHHANGRVNYGTVFPWTDYLFNTWRDRRRAPSSRAKSELVRSSPNSTEGHGD